jgi:hypothetical protein
VAEDATAYPQRDAAFKREHQRCLARGRPTGRRALRWARDFYGAVEPHVGGRAYVNFLGDEGEERVRAAYGEEKYERLRALKRRCAPTNVFRLNQNIRP